MDVIYRFAGATFITFLFLVYSNTYRPLIYKFLYRNSARPYRELLESEVDELQNYLKYNPDQRILNFGYNTYLIIKYGYLFILSGMLGAPIFFTFFGWSQMSFFAFIIIFLSIFFYVYNQNKKDVEVFDYQADLKQPVYLAQGEYVIEKRLDSGKKLFSWDFTVNKLVFFKNAGYKDVKKIISSLESGDKIAIEFSPNSHYIWKIEKLHG